MHCNALIMILNAFSMFLMNSWNVDDDLMFTNVFVMFLDALAIIHNAKTKF